MLGSPPRPFSVRPARAWRTVFASLALVATSGAAPERDVAYFTRTWTTDDGLPHNSTSRVIQDAAGFMWFATVGGLARFDGREFRELRPPAEFRANGFNIRGLAEEKPGTLIVLPTGGGVLRLQGSTWSVHPATSALAALADDFPADLHVDPQGNLWFVLSSARLLRWQLDGTTKIFPRQPADNARLPKFTFATDPAGNTWISSESWLAVYRDDELQHYELPPGEPVLIGSGPAGRIWVCTDRRLKRLERGKLVTVAEDVPWLGAFGAIRDVFEDSRGCVWIASSRRGLFASTEGRVRHVPTPYSSVSHIMEDREGNIWVATEGGIGQLREKAYQQFNQTSGLPHDAVSSISQDGTGRIWLANRPGGLASVSPENGELRIEHRVSQTGSPRIYANVVCADRRGRVWFGGGRSGLQRWQPGGSQPAETLPLPNDGLHLLFVAQNNDVWFAANPGMLGYYRSDEVRVFSAADGFNPQDIRAVAQDRRGDIWLGGRSGELLKWDGNRFHTFSRELGWAKRPIHAIFAEGTDRLWIGTVGGLVLKEGEHFALLTPAEGLADDIIHGILEDDHGRMWFAARRGLFYAAKAELLEAARNKAARVSSHMLGRNQGLVGVTPIVNYSPATCKARDGRLWFATAQGAVAVDPSRLPRDLPPPPVIIDEVRWNGRIMSPSATLRFPSGQNRADFRFAALSFTAPENVILRHQLEGVDPGWIDTGSDRTASYARLAPGDYRLRVIARNSAGGWNNDGAVLAFTVVPAWWETIHFRIGVIALLVGFTAWLARTLAQRRLQLKLRRLEQEHALEKERARIARDLHDDLGASLTEVGLLADRLVGAAPRELAPQLSGLAWRTRRLATELSGIVWTMSANNSSLDRLAEFLRRYAERLFRNTGTRCIVLGVEGIPPLPLPPEPQHQVLAAAKEAINNILKHARATEAVIRMRYVDGTFEVWIGDDGAGFAMDAAYAVDGNGLRNMRSRIEEIGGTFELLSAPGQGTQVVLQTPCPLPPLGK